MSDTDKFINGRYTKAYAKGLIEKVKKLQIDNPAAGKEAAKSLAASFKDIGIDGISVNKDTGSPIFNKTKHIIPGEKAEKEVLTRIKGSKAEKELVQRFKGKAPSKELKTTIKNVTKKIHKPKSMSLSKGPDFTNNIARKLEALRSQRMGKTLSKAGSKVMGKVMKSGLKMLPIIGPIAAMALSSEDASASIPILDQIGMTGATEEQDPLTYAVEHPSGDPQADAKKIKELMKRKALADMSGR